MESAVCPIVVIVWPRSSQNPAPSGPLFEAPLPRPLPRPLPFLPRHFVDRFLRNPAPTPEFKDVKIRFSLPKGVILGFRLGFDG